MHWFANGHFCISLNMIYLFLTFFFICAVIPTVKHKYSSCGGKVIWKNLRNIKYLSLSFSSNTLFSFQMR